MPPWEAEAVLSLLSCHAGHSVRSMIAYRTQFWIEVLGTGVRFATGVLSLTVIFGNVGTINGWSQASAGVVLGVFFIVTGLHGIVFGPSIGALSGYDGAIVSGTLDFPSAAPAKHPGAGERRALDAPHGGGGGRRCRRRRTCVGFAGE